MADTSEDDQANPFASPKTATASKPADHPKIPLEHYAKVRLGLQIVYNSIGILAGVFVLTSASAVFLVFTVSSTGGSALRTLFFSCIGLICLIAMLALIAGFCMTLASPRRDEKTFAITSVVCFFLAIAGAFAGTLLAWAAGIGLGALLSLTASVLSNVSAISFCLLLKRIGRNIASFRLQVSARSMLVWYGIFFTIGVTGLIVMLLSSFQLRRATGPQNSSSEIVFIDWFGTVFGFAIFIVALVNLFKYLAMLRTGINELKPQAVSTRNYRSRYG